MGGVASSMTIAEAMAKSTDLPICWACAKGEGSTGYARSLIASSVGTCCVCEQTKPCSAIRDWIWPKALYRGRERLETK